jgi:integrase
MKLLSALAVSKLKAPGRYAVGYGAYLQITGDNGRSWVFRYSDPVTKKPRHMGLGSCQLYTLEEAREKAREARRQIRDGIDPLQSRDTSRHVARLEAARAMTFQDAAARYIAAHEAGWRNEVHKRQWRTTLESYVYPTCGKLPVAMVDTALVIKILEPIWTTKPETAGRVRGRVESILDWAKAHGFREGENPARWKGHLDNLLAKRSKVRKVKHHAALPYAEAGAFMVDLRQREGLGARALEFTILTAARTGEAIGARRSEIDLKERAWNIPGERTKSGRPHRVPLSGAAIELLAALPSEGAYLFPGAKAGKPLSNMAMLETLRRMGRDDLTAHGFRSTFKDWASECTAYPGELSEAALAHVIDDKTEAAYRRGDLFEKRRRMMADWAKHCATLAAPAGEVVPLRGRSA